MDWLNNLRNMKKASGLSMREISEQSGMSEPTLEKLFAGNVKDPKVSTLNALVHFFGYTLDDLTADPGNKKAPTMTGERKQLMDLIPYLSDEAVHAMLILAAQAAQQK